MEVIRVATLVNGIKLQKAKYDLSEVFVDSKKSEYDTNNQDNTAKDNNVVDESEQSMDIAVVALIFQTFASDQALDSTLKTLTIDPDLEKLCTTFVTSKSTQIVKWHKNRTPANNKLEEININL